MKLSHEFNDEQQANARLRALQAAGYTVWLTQKPDGTWEVFWLTDSKR